MYSSSNLNWVIESRRMRWVGQVAYMRARKCIRTLGGKPDGKRPLGRPRQRW
jgi:hypothetical protein